MKANQARYPVATTCRLLGVSTSGYYAGLKRGPSQRAREDTWLTERIQSIHTRSRGTYGAPRIHAELCDEGILVGRKRIARLMRAAGLCGVSRRKRPHTTVRRAAARPAPDLVERDFTAPGPNRLWVADITYVPTWAGTLYLAIVVDVWSRRVVGWAMETHLRKGIGPGRSGNGAPATAPRGRRSPFGPGEPIHIVRLRKTLPRRRRPSIDGLRR